jgi:hypothetical protein
VCRSEADWLVGINGTRAMTAFNSKSGGFQLTTVGRVQTPTLAIMVEREEKIRAFVPRRLLGSRRHVQAKGGEYAGRWFDEKFKKAEDDPDARAERVWDEQRARAVADKCVGKPGTVTEESKPSTQSPPLLYDLTSLQREANGRFGFPARMTLSLAQALYEKHKVLTYPRTDSRALPEDYIGTVKFTLEELGETNAFGGFAREILKQKWVKPNKRIFDNSKISDHFAIIPTLVRPKHLNEAEAKLYDFVVRRFLAVFYPAAEHLVTTRITRVEGEPFKTEGKVLVTPGWLAVYGKEAQARKRRSRRSSRTRRSPPRRSTSTRSSRGRRRATTKARCCRPWKARARPSRRRAARGDAREGPRHAGDPRVDHRRPHQRALHPSRRQGAHAHREGVLAHDAAAWPRHSRALLAGAHGRVGVQARADGARQAEASRLHGRDREDDRAHRRQAKNYESDTIPATSPR